MWQRLFFCLGYAAMRLAVAIFDITKSNEKINLYRFWFLSGRTTLASCQRK
ncbi:hypothetical protein [Vogesella indigofera]|uniref:hypothetical protein n=1 Tax=Vogesella indigofera TaxID=45465 RepID=UPI00234F142B|nr:hypothetical protein [Vogesella indigofera]MDC7701598.1 hypothetical protein [Vogesella indigofera]